MSLVSKATLISSSSCWKMEQMPKKGSDHFSPLHIAIKRLNFSVCKLILEYEQLSNQNIESGITKIIRDPIINGKGLKETTKGYSSKFKMRLIRFRALLILNSPKRYVASASRFHRSDTSVPDARLRSIAARYISVH
jgi:hypothetical protein